MGGERKGELKVHFRGVRRRDKLWYEIQKRKKIKETDANSQTLGGKDNKGAPRRGALGDSSTAAGGGKLPRHPDPPLCSGHYRQERKEG